MGSWIRLLYVTLLNCKMDTLQVAGLDSKIDSLQVVWLDEKLDKVTLCNKTSSKLDRFTGYRPRRLYRFTQHRPR